MKISSFAAFVSERTPADEHVDDKVSLGEDDDQQCVEVQSLHQQPEEVGHDEVVEKHQTGSTAHLRNKKAFCLHLLTWTFLRIKKLNVRCHYFRVSCINRAMNEKRLMVQQTQPAKIRNEQKNN